LQIASQNVKQQTTKVTVNHKDNAESDNLYNYDIIRVN